MDNENSPEVEVEVSAADKVAAAFSEQPEQPSPPVAEENSAPASNSTGHPAWQEVFSAVPEMFHDKLRPVLDKWDKGVQEKLSEYNQKYSAFEPLVGSDPQEIRAGYELIRHLQADPEGFYKQLAEHYGFSKPGQGQQSTEQTEVDLSEYSDDLTVNPQFKALQEQQQKLLEMMQAQQQAEANKQAEAWLAGKQEEITKTLSQKNITPEWGLILPAAAAKAQQSGNYDAALEQAVNEFVTTVEKFRAPVATLNAPPVVAPGGAVPVTQTKIEEMSGDDRRKLMAQYLTQALKE